MSIALIIATFESQAVVRGVPEEIGGVHIVAMMCRFGAGMIWISEFMA